jgi:hypothetical protein
VHQAAEAGAAGVGAGGGEGVGDGEGLGDGEKVGDEVGLDDTEMGLDEVVLGAATCSCYRGHEGGTWAAVLRRGRQIY